MSCEFSVGWVVKNKKRTQSGAIPKTSVDAFDADGVHRDGAGLAEITHALPARAP